MMLEYVGLTTLTNTITREKIIIIRKEKACEYKELPFADPRHFGVFIDDNKKIIGINTFSDYDYYSPNKIIEKLQPHIDELSRGEPDHDRQLLDWWNNLYENEWKKRQRNITDTAQTIVKQEKLQDHFNMISESDDGSVWTTYYINPPIPLEIQLSDDHKISFLDYKIRKILSYKGTLDVYYQTLYCYDEKYEWVQELDINTNNKEDQVKFIFDTDDLQRSSLNLNKEQLSYIELHENINPYRNVQGNRKIFKEWLEKHSLSLEYLGDLPVEVEFVQKKEKEDIKK